MEALPSLPLDLIALAGPMARGTAPLLRPGEADTELGGTSLPFELYLALLTPPLPPGEALPGSGKELPPGASFFAASPARGPSPLAPVAADAALLTRLGLGSADGALGFENAAPASPFASTDTLAAPALPSAAQEPLPGAAAATASGEPLAATTPALVMEPVVPQTAELSAPGTLDSATLLDSAAPEVAHPPRPQADLTVEQNALAPQARASFRAPESRVGEAALQDGAPQLEVTKLSQTMVPAVVEASSVAADWLPAGHGTTANGGPVTSAAAAAPGVPVDVRTPNWQEAFASRVQWLAGSHAGEARITLNPPELGAVDVKISLVDDKTYVQLTAATAAARDELSQSLPRLRDLFAASGIELGGASVQDGSGGNRAGYDAHRYAMPERPTLAPFASLADEPQAEAVARRPLGRVDLFA
jgi:flagellar hook-length control protein FliK